MRLNLAVLALTGVTMLAGIGCGEGDLPADEASAGAPITVTEMEQLADGTWKTIATRTIPRGQSVRPDLGDGVEARQNPLYVLSNCNNGFDVFMTRGTMFDGDQLCLRTNSNFQTLNFGWFFSARSVFTYTPLYVYDANNNLVFWNCNQTVKASNNVWPPATSAQQASPQSGVCHF